MYNSDVPTLKQLIRLPTKVAVQKILELLVGIKLRRTRPKIIGITGSFGKTSTKDAIYEVLRTRWKVYRNPKSLNTEFGLALAILEQPSGFSSASKWGRILVRAFMNAFFGRKYDYMILEYGADKPGDIGHLVKLAKPDIAVITHIARTHQAAGQFASTEDVFKEKKRLVTALCKHGIAILNAEDKFLRGLDGKLKAKTMWFGAGALEGASGGADSADIYATNLKNTSTGFSAMVHLGKQKVHANFGIPGKHHINIILLALLCGVLNDIPLKEGIISLESYKLPPGRMSIIEGIGGSTLLDSSYNSSPQTVREALELLKEFPNSEYGGGTHGNRSRNRKIAVLGNMNELGDFTEEAHKEVAESIGPWLDMLITVGKFAALIGETALKNGFPESRIKTLTGAEEAAAFLQGALLGKGDIVLFKGSQNLVRLERAVKSLMAHPKDAHELLCRQEKVWETIK